MKGLRTLLTNGVAFIASLTEYFGDFTVSVDDQTALVGAGLALVNFVLRMVTTTPVGQK